MVRRNSLDSAFYNNALAVLEVLAKQRYDQLVRSARSELSDRNSPRPHLVAVVCCSTARGPPVSGAGPHPGEPK